MGKKQPQHARGNNAWVDALKRAVRSIRPALETAVVGAAGEATKALVGALTQ
ncbi:MULTISPECIES: hypothetical protein [unclassified Streptomyces]|uniref:hypothetical protein n=1 Tax=unclassified Streptomyces TaxID=2593676 RepID=UPI0033B2B1B4